ncbi:disulfide bond formation protein B [Craterilacuibacter sp. RT1T]|uniref:disulfide bond formation protein B n=1 Tax=Craterilacuibacter sp. RT1T TaxID=2942211 RepID=UPI0020C030D3|nr:disulfide bond formation protein B [Craterilacuibacter sp. RT1T]MCL6263836.1 disulfide bond formation protein B [Craterilacuibacter sp. RT1T]
MLHTSNWNRVFLAWLLALASTLGALFFSEVMHIEPCVLCWYQRIAMFPLVLILGTGLLYADGSAIRYALPLSLAGTLFALYHNLIYAGLIPQDLQPCGQGSSSCAQIDLQLFGFITLPLLSLLAFAAINILLLLTRKSLNREK